MTKLAVHIILDRSGSMASIKDDAIGGLNSYIKTLEPDTKVWLTMFDSTSIDTTIHGQAAATIEKITFEPRGMTPLYDAIGRIIPSLEAADADNKALVILTDGRENHSREYTKDAILKLLTEKQEKDNWLVLYLGANQDAFQEGSRIGTVSMNTMDFAPTKMREAFSSTAQATIRYGNTGSREAAAFTPEERQAAL